MTDPNSTAATPDVMAVIAQLDQMNPNSLLRRMQIEIVEASPQRIVATMPVEGNTQPYGLLHGGASVVLSETLGSIGSAIHAGLGRIAVGVDINATHHRAARSGTVTAVATPLSLGRSICVWETVVTDDTGARICTSRLTCLLRDRPPGDGGADRSGVDAAPASSDCEASQGEVA